MHIQRNWGGGVLFSLLVSLLVAGCGGGNQDAGPSIVGTPEGIYSGTSSNGRTVWGTVLDNGQFWFVYSGIGSPGIVNGLTQGPYQAANGTFTSTDVRDFSMDQGRFTETIVGTYHPQESLTGTTTIVTGEGGASFALTHQSQQPVDLNVVAGTYPTGLGGSVQDPFTVSIAVDGTVTFPGPPFSSYGMMSGIIVNCQKAGQLTPRAQVNTFDFVLTTTPCFFPSRGSIPG